MASDPTQPGGRQPDLLGHEEDADIPPPPYGAAADPIDDDAQERLQRMSRRGRLLPTVLVLVAIGAFIGIVWWAYQTANLSEAPTEIPVVEAEPGDPKVRPESEGGMTVPNQDKLIYEQLGQSGQGEGQPEVERLLPPPEEPLEPPAPPAPEPAAPAVDTAELTPPPPPQEIAPSAETAESQAPAPEQPEAAAPAEAEPAVAAPQPAAPEAPASEAPAAAAEEPAPAPAPTPEPAAETAAAGSGFRVQLAALKTEADAQQAWAKLQKAHPDLLGKLQPTIQRADLGDQGIFYRVQAGSLPSREAAAALCDGLKKKNQACLVVKP